MIGQVDYAIVYFNKAKGCKYPSIAVIHRKHPAVRMNISVFGLGAPKGNEIVISRLRLVSLEDTVVYVSEQQYLIGHISHRSISVSLFYRYSGLCQAQSRIPASTSETVLLNRADCQA